MAAVRPVDILMRLQRITAGLEQGMSQALIMSEVKDLVATEAIYMSGCDGNVRQILNLLTDSQHGVDEILEEIRIVEEFLHTDEYGFREHKNGWDYL